VRKHPIDEEGKGGGQRRLWPLLASSGAPTWTRCHLGRLGSGSSQFWVAPVWAKKAEWGKCSAAPLDQAEREQGERAQRSAAARRGGGDRRDAAA
jgi:hypothetical protein